MKNTSIWLNEKDESLRKIDKDMEVDVLIVGGGLTGLSTMLELKDSKLNVVLVERNTCGHGVTSRSTAKITYLQENIYANIRSLVSEEAASIYLKSQLDAIELLNNHIKKYKIDCNLTQVSSYLFTNDEKNVEKLNQEYDFLVKNHIDVKKEKLEDVPNIMALKVDDTYTFNPLKYVLALKNILSNHIYEHSKVEDIKKDQDYYYAKVNGFIIRAKYVVIATHYPYFLIPMLFPFKNHVETSYVGARRVSKVKNISAINIDNPCISLRYYQDGKKNYLIYLYQSYSSCNIKSIQENFFELNKLMDFEYVWSNKDIITNDYMPYIGRVYKDDDTFLIACGYNTWGMTNATLAGKILSDIILKKDNPYINAFAPNRKFNLSKFVRFSIDVGCSIKSIIKSSKGNVNNRKVIYKKIDGKSVAIYIDEKGREHTVLNRCPHMKCGLVFNEVEKTWDCLCHGSRFTLDGNTIEGPSNFDIRFP